MKYNFLEYHVCFKQLNNFNSFNVANKMPFTATKDIAFLKQCGFEQIY